MRRVVVGVLLLAAVGAGAQDWWPPRPVLGYNIFTDEQEVWLGELVAEDAGLNANLYEDAEATAYLQALGERVAAKSKRPELKYKFVLVDSTKINATAVPGGRIYVNRGMVAFCETEAELAAVLGHEIAHVALRQGARTFSRWLLMVAGITQVGNQEDVKGKYQKLRREMVASLLFQAAADLLLGVQRSDEIWADRYGIWNAHAAGYDPRAAVSSFRRLDELVKGPPGERSSDAWVGLLENLVSTHPSSGNRAKLLEGEIRWMKENPEVVVDTEEYQEFRKRVVPAPPEPPPENGEK